MRCDICVEVCNFDAIAMNNTWEGIELSCYDRNDLVMDKDALMHQHRSGDLNDPFREPMGVAHSGWAPHIDESDEHAALASRPETASLARERTVAKAAAKAEEEAALPLRGSATTDAAQPNRQPPRRGRLAGSARRHDVRRSHFLFRRGRYRCRRPGRSHAKNAYSRGAFLILSLIAVAAIFILLAAEFLAIVQVLVYGGAVTILILFAMMLTRVRDMPKALNGPQAPIAALVAGAFGVTSVVAIANTKVPGESDKINVIAFEDLGDALFTTWAMPFEIASLVLIVALLGAIVIARGEEGE
jgi:NADH-quinone oxidoreductase subunit J